MAVRIVIILLCVTTFLIGNQEKYDAAWCNRLISNPDLIFADSYEKNLFQSFSAKNQVLKVDVSLIDTTRNFVVSKLILDSASYTLILALNNKGKVLRVFRNVPIIQSEHILLQNWLGALLYRIDAGNQSILEDFFFPGDIQLTYRGQSKKRQLIRQLLNDFPGIIRINEVVVDENPVQYRLMLTMSNLYELDITLPKSILQFANIDEQAEILFQRFLQDIRNPAEPPPENQYSLDFESQLRLLSAYYSEITVSKNELILHYPSLDDLPKSQMNYHWDSVQGLMPDFNLKYDASRKQLLFNKSLAIGVSTHHMNDTELQRKAQNVIVRVINLLLPRSNLFIPDSTAFPTTEFIYNAYNPQKLAITTRNEWLQLKQIVFNEGALYYYPSFISLNDDSLTLTGLVYIIPNKPDTHHHFSELRTTFLMSNSDPKIREIHWIFYPYLRNKRLHWSKH